MKLSRNEFKGIIKECLIEILSEGMGNHTTLRESLSQRSTSAAVSKSTPANRRPSDTVAYSTTNYQKQPALDKKRISEVIKAESNGDPVLAAILADTASTTLPNMLMNESSRQPPLPVGSIESVVASKNPEELFGDEAASKWAALAFMNPQKNF